MSVRTEGIIGDTFCPWGRFRTYLNTVFTCFKSLNSTDIPTGLVCSWCWILEITSLWMTGRGMAILDLRNLVRAIFSINSLEEFSVTLVLILEISALLIAENISVLLAEAITSKSSLAVMVGVWLDMGLGVR